MPLPGPPPDASSDVLADWLELLALVSPDGIALTQDLAAPLEIEEDFEPEELDEEDLLAEGRLSAALTEIEDRRRCLEEAYPFDVYPDGGRLLLREEPGIGGYIYLFCLILSHVVGDGLLREERRPDLQSARDLFQVCATLAAADWCQGPSFSFGWPRPDHSDFFQKLQAIWRDFRDGKVRGEYPTWAPPAAKDDRIDVIAWRRERNGHPGTLFLLGQAASGANWRGKSVKTAIDVFLETWFEIRPASTPVPMMFIPFCLPSLSGSNEYVSQEEILGRLERERIERRIGRLVHEYGHILYRYRLPARAAAALKLPAAGIEPIERIDDLPKIVEWVTTTRMILRD